MRTFKERCCICGGRQVIRLPVRRPVRHILPAEPSQPMGETSREYPCPECAPTVDEARVVVFSAQQETRPWEMERLDADQAKEYAEHMRRSVVDDLAYALAKSDAVTIQTQRSVETGAVRVRAHVGVVSASHTQSMEERAKIAAERMCAGAAEAVVERMRLHGHQVIHKDDAARLIRDEFKRAAAAWAR